MRKVLATLGAAVLVLSLSACGGEAKTRVDTGTSGIGTYSVPLEDGRTVICAVYGKGGITCDWEGAK